MASDLHIRDNIKGNKLEKDVEIINGLKPDIVLLVGDIADRFVEPLIHQDAGSVLGRLKSTYGVYAVTGNHEYFGDVNRTVSYLSDHGIKFLRDEVVLIGRSFYLAGREDRTSERYNGKKRKSIKGILKTVNKNHPVILMDHQPYNFSEPEENLIDLQVSGHSHNGQLFPLGYLFEIYYEKSWGYLKRGKTHFYVSSGAGTAGPPVRVGTISEIVNIKINLRELSVIYQHSAFLEIKPLQPVKVEWFVQIVKSFMNLYFD